jgi:hypothetical protein
VTRRCILAAAALALPGQQATASPPAPAMLSVGGIDHVGITVPDASAAAAFFHDLVGSRIVSDTRPSDISQD